MTENKNFLESLSENRKPESFEQETFIPVKNTKTKMRLVIVLMLIVTVALLIFVMYQTSMHVTLIDLVGLTIDDAAVWAQKNDIVLITSNVYSFDSKERFILDQDPSPGGEIKKNDLITVKVSAGPDPDEIVVFPDVMSMTSDEINKWIETNKLTGVRITTSSSHVVPENSVIEYSFVDGNSTTFKRKNRVNIVISTGPDILSDTVVVSDFTTMSVGNILKWSEENKVKIDILEEFNSYINAGTVIKQDIKSGTEIFRTDTITVYISKGQPINVPDLTGLSKEEINIWAKQYGVNITFIERYNSQFSKGKVVSQSVPLNSLIEKGGELILVCSLGEVDVASYIDRTKLDILTWQTEVNNKGADIELIFKENYGDKGSLGKIIGQSVLNDRVAPGTVIEVTVSLGELTNSVTVPDFSNMTINTAMKWSEENGVKIEIIKEFNNYINSGSVIRQSVASGTKISKTQKIDIFISKGEAVTVPDLINCLKEEINLWAKQNNITVTSVERYNKEILKGKVISQNINPGTVIEKGSEILLVYSLGKIDITSFIGKTKLDILTWQTEVNSKGADIELTFVESYGDKGTLGKIISQSILNDSIAPGTIIEITLSKGAIVIVPDFKGKTEKEVSSIVNEQKLTVQYEYEVSETIAPGCVIRQSHTVGTLILDSQLIVLTLAISENALDTVVVPNFSGMSVEEIIDWAYQNGMDLEIYEYYSENTEANSVIDQSINSGALIKRGSTIRIVISKGKAP